MTKKEFKTSDKKGRESTWEWEETPEVTEALKKLRTSTEKLHQDIRNGKS